jgi:hypothetical protein
MKARVSAQTIKTALLVLPFLILLLTAVSNIVVAARVSDSGVKALELEGKYHSLSKKNEEMVRELATKQSLITLKDQAIAAGFVPRQTPIVLESPKLAKAN